MNSRPWIPLLEGPTRRAALDRVERFAAALEPVAAEEKDASVILGQSGFALFFHHASSVPGLERYHALGESCLDRAIDALASEDITPGYDRGIAGIAWTAQHLRAAANASPDDDACTDIDDLLLTYVSHTPWTRGFDLSEGLVGIGLYALERMPRPAARRILEQVHARLTELAVTTPSGVAWRTPQAWLPEGMNRAGANGGFNLGVPHGVPGVLGMLAAMRAWDVGDAALLERSVDWALDVAARFPALPDLLVDDAPVKTTKLYGWCYGMPNLAGVLLLAARAAGNAGWEARARSLALASRGEPDPTVARVVDACLCHGAGGLGHQYNRMGQWLGDAALLDEARRWYDRVLALDTPGAALAGYPQRFPRDDGTTSSRVTPGLAGGIAGLGLSLLSAATDLEPTWDRSCLLSFPEPS